jgi:hypothetical protein
MLAPLSLQSIAMSSVVRRHDGAELLFALIARLGGTLKDFPLLFPPLKHIALEIASFCGLVYLLLQLWKHL